MDQEFKNLVLRFMKVMLRYVLFKGVGTKLFDTVESLVNEIEEYESGEDVI